MKAARKKAPVDTAPPVIEHTPPISCAVDVACVIEAQITDPSGVFDPTLLFRTAGAATFERAPMQTVAGTPSLFRATVPAALLAAGAVEYLIEAFDIQGNGPARAGSDATPLRVASAPPIAKTTLPASEPTPPVTTAAGDGATATDSTGLVVGLVAGGAAVALLVGGGIVWAVWSARPSGVDVVAVTIAAPVPQALVGGGAR